MSIRLIAVDIDGTLVNSKKEITPEVFEAIQDAKAAESRLSLQQDALLQVLLNFLTTYS